MPCTHIMLAYWLSLKSKQVFELVMMDMFSKTSVTLLKQKATDVIRNLTPTSSPLSSPSKHGDRFIPSRAGANWSINFHRINVNTIASVLFSTTLFTHHFVIMHYLFVYAIRRICQFRFQENERSPSQNRKTKDASTDNSKGRPSQLDITA